MHLRRRSSVGVAVAAAVLALSLAGGASAAGFHVYVADPAAGGVRQYAADPATGALTPLEPDLVTTGGSPSAIAMSPDGRNLYAADASGIDTGVFQFAVDPVGGGLSALTPAKVPTGGSGLLSIAVSPNGRDVFGSNYGGGNVTQATRDQQTGTLALKTPPLVGIPGGYNAIGLAIAPSGRSAYATQYTADGVAQFAVSPSTGGLAPLTPAVAGLVIAPPVPEASPAITPDGTHLYAGGVVPAAPPAGNLPRLDGFPIDPLTGALGPTLGGMPEQAVGRGLAITGDGQRLYGSDGSSIHQFAIGGGGALSALNPATVGVPARDIAVAPDGRHAYAVTASDVAQLLIGSDGSLTPASPANVAGGGAGIVVSPDQPPAAAISAAGSAGPGQAVVLDASGSVDPDGTIATYRWDFGDGSPVQTTTGPRATHAYASAGTFTATVAVTDADGCSQAIVFTGQTALCNGGPGARAAAGVVVSPASPAAPSAPGAAVPAPASCTSRRAFLAQALRLRRGERITAARVVERGRTVRRLRATGGTVRVDLRRLPKGTFSLVLSVRRGARTRTVTRTYRTCTPG